MKNNSQCRHRVNVAMMELMCKYVSLERKMYGAEELFSMSHFVYIYYYGLPVFGSRLINIKIIINL